MQIYTGFLLSYTRYGDHDAFLHFFTEEAGYQSFYARGLYVAKNKKKPHLFPLNLLTIVAARKGGSVRTQTVSRLEPASDIAALTDVRLQSVLFFCAEFLQQILKEEHPNPHAFRHIEKLMEEIRAKSSTAHLRLLINFLAICGIAPLRAEGKFLDPEAGRFVEVMAHPIFDEKISRWWKSVLFNDNGNSLPTERNDRNAFLDSLLLYYQLHFPGFQIPKSLAVLREIFS